MRRWRRWYYLTFPRGLNLRAARRWLIAGIAAWAMVGSYYLPASGPVSGASLPPAGRGAPPKPPVAETAAAPTAAAPTAAAPYPAGPQAINTYARGNCTWYVAHRRYVPNHWGNAVHWLAAARAAGWTTGTTPRAGAIAWSSMGWAGHVAYVEAVSGNSVTVSEMNVRGWGVIDRRTVPAGYFYYIY